MAQVRRRRPWIAALLGLVFTGFGHLYLRRWLRAVGWIAAVYISSYFVPQSALETFSTAMNTMLSNPGALQNTTLPYLELLPIISVGVASIADAYLIAKMNNQIVEEVEQGIQRCPSCSKKIEDTVNFCQWCGTDLDDVNF